MTILIMIELDCSSAVRRRIGAGVSGQGMNTTGMDPHQLLDPFFCIQPALYQIQVTPVKLAHVKYVTGLTQARCAYLAAI